MSYIKHRTQTLPDNCVSTCIAMVLNFDVDEVTEYFHEKYKSNEMQPRDVFDKVGIPYRRCYADERELFPGHVYLVTVPSINIQAATHQIVIHVEEDGAYLFDPALGREGRKSYALFHKDEDIPEDKVQIGSWSPDYEFKIEDIHSAYELETKLTPWW